MISLALLALLFVILVVAVAVNQPPQALPRGEAERRLRETPRGNVTVLRESQDDDPLIGRCDRCGRWWSQHPGGYCPDGIDAGGLVDSKGPVFELGEESERAG